MKLFTVLEPRARGLFVLASLLAACGPGAVAPNDAAAPDTATAPPDAAPSPPDAGSDSGRLLPDVANPCDAGMHPGESGACTVGLRWTPSPMHYPVALDHHVTFVHEGPDGAARLYVVGGVYGVNHMLGRAYADARSAPIGPDGALGEWTQTAALPTRLFGHSVAVVRDRVYITGGVAVGTTDTSTSAEVYTTRVNADGTLAAWERGPAMPTARFHHVSLVAGDRLYVLGGRASERTQAQLTEVAFAPIAADGTLGAWTTTTPLPIALAYHGGVAQGDALYVTGGLTAAGSAVTAARRAAVNADGTLGPWTMAGTLDDVAIAHSSLVRDGWMYLLGGLDAGGMATDAIRRARIGDDGALGAWEPVDAPLPLPRGHVHQRPVYRQWIYAVGGVDAMEASSSDVAVGEFF